MSEIENMMPWERQVYKTLLMQYLDQVKQEQIDKSFIRRNNMAHGFAGYEDARTDMGYIGKIFDFEKDIFFLFLGSLLGRHYIVN